LSLFPEENMFPLDLLSHSVPFFLHGIGADWRPTILKPFGFLYLHHWDAYDPGFESMLFWYMLIHVF